MQGHAQTAHSITPPVAIGGLGGSGTRVFAALLQYAGVSIGKTLNQPLDNLWFTVLFKRMAWARGRPDPTDVATSVRLFRRAMTEGLQNSLNPDDSALIARLRADLPPEGGWNCGAKTQDADALSCSRPAHSRTTVPFRWGWKEPNTHIFLPDLDRHIPGLQYIHVVRDGLDMALSKNTWQARNWAHLYGLAQDADTSLPVHQLRYWVAANRAALEYGERHMQGRFLVMHYDDFCARPEVNWQRMSRFLGLGPDLTLPEDLVRPTTIGRSSDHDLSMFPKDVLADARDVQSIVAEKTGASGLA